jgi:hypothetical protein
MNFTMSGLELVNDPGKTEVKVVLKPGETRLIELKAVSYPWKIACSIKSGVR